MSVIWMFDARLTIFQVVVAVASRSTCISDASPGIHLVLACVEIFQPDGRTQCLSVVAALAPVKLKNHLLAVALQRHLVVLSVADSNV